MGCTKYTLNTLTVKTATPNIELINVNGIDHFSFSSDFLIST